jgi:YHS domain-containing protein
MRKDPVCGRDIDPVRARAMAIVGGDKMYFCSRAHRDEYLRRPLGRDEWDEPTPLPPIVAPETEHIPALALAAPGRRTIWAFLVGFLRRFTL